MHQHDPSRDGNDAPPSNPRRDALKQIASGSLGAAALAAPGISQAALPFPWSVLEKATSGILGGLGQPAPKPAALNVRRAPLAVSMWDYSWLTRRAGPQAEYADFDAILDDFVLRGYNALRIEAFPHLIASDENGRHQNEFVMKAQPSGFPWGNSFDTKVNPRRDLPVFLSKCAARGIRVGLSTWLRNDTSNRANRIQSPTQLARIWIETLEFLGQHRLLDIIEWVDLSNEFPSVQFAPAIVDYLNQRLSNKINQLHGAALPYNQQQSRAISTYIYTAIHGLKKQFPQLPFCVSLLSNGPADSYKLVDLSPMDCLEPHIWVCLNQAFAVPSGMNLFLLQGLGPLQPKVFNDGIEKWAQSAYYRRKAGLLLWLESAMDSWVTLGNKLNVPVYTTEAWGPINYYDVGDKDPAGTNWNWIRDVGMEAARMAKARGWTGICSSNFCQPQFPGFYQNPAWHQQFTSLVKAT